MGSYSEKSVWVQLVAMVVVLGGYFGVAGVMMANGVVALPSYVPLFAAAVVLMVVVLALGHVAALVGERLGGPASPGGRSPDKPDERDRLIGWRAESNAAWIVGAGVICGIGAMVVGVGPVWVAHLLLGSMFVSEVLKYTLQIVYYRRGMGGM